MNKLNGIKTVIFLFLTIVYVNIFIFKTMNDNKLSNCIVSNINLTVISNALTIFSCFYDKRYNSLRLLGIASNLINFSCSFKLNNNKYLCDIEYIKFEKDSSGYNYNRSYINIIINLKKNSSYPSKVKVNNIYYDVIYNHLGRKINVLCITTFKNFFSYSLFTQSLKLYYKYGITDVYIYSSDIHTELKKIIIIDGLKYHFLFLHNEFYFNNTFYFGQIVKYNDCLYRNMYRSNYIVFTDYDELILLNKWNRYDELIKKYPLGDIYYFKSALCPTNNTVQHKQFKKLNDVNIIRTLNCCMLSSYYHRKYLISTPYKFLKINIHYIDYQYEKAKHVFVNEDEGYIHHSRIPTYMLMNHCSNWFFDLHLTKLLE